MVRAFLTRLTMTFNTTIAAIITTWIILNATFVEGIEHFLILTFFTIVSTLWIMSLIDIEEEDDTEYIVCLSCNRGVRVQHKVYSIEAAHSVVERYMRKNQSKRLFTNPPLCSDTKIWDSLSDGSWFSITAL
jgi:hypothetical protein